MTLLRFYRKLKILDLIKGLFFLLVVLLIPIEIKADSDSGFFQSMDASSYFVVETTDSQVNVLKTISDNNDIYESKHLIWQAGFGWSDKALGPEYFNLTDVLEEILAITEWLS